MEEPPKICAILTGKKRFVIKWETYLGVLIKLLITIKRVPSLYLPFFFKKAFSNQIRVDLTLQIHVDLKFQCLIADENPPPTPTIL